MNTDFPACGIALVHGEWIGCRVSKRFVAFFLSAQYGLCVAPLTQSLKLCWPLQFIHNTETKGSQSLAPKMALPVFNPHDWTVNTGQHKGLRFSTAFSCVLEIVQNLNSVKKGQVTLWSGHSRKSV